MWMQYPIEVRSEGRGTYDITQQVNARIAGSGVEVGLAQLFIHHTSASLIVCENADPLVRSDLETFMGRVAPDGDPMFRHADEGPDDMPAHVRTILTQTGLTIPVTHARLGLGTWQGLYLWEHRTQPHRRSITLTICGSSDANSTSGRD